MDNPFFERPILNSPYVYPARHWELDDAGQPTQKILEKRRRAEFITPIPQPRKRKSKNQQTAAKAPKASLNSDTSRPFDKPRSGRIAVKVINHLGDEVMKVFRIK